MQAKPGDLLLFHCRYLGSQLQGVVRIDGNVVGTALELYDPKELHFSWVVEFPMFDRDEDAGQWTAMHHPFTAPRAQDLEFVGFRSRRFARAQAYDLVISGYEAGGGTIRIHDNRVQQQVFGLLGLSEQSAEERFGFLLDALKFGAPPHGGIALGIDRIVMLFGGLENIRDCITFPKTQKATDLMTEAPNAVDDVQLQELGIEIAETDETA
jgi:aspartyl-tRNA synthetase